MSARKQGAVDIPDSVLRKAWVAGAKVSWGRRSMNEVWNGKTADEMFRPHRDLPAMRAASKIIIAFALQGGAK